MSTTEHYYQMNDFDNIIYRGFSYSLPLDVIHKIQDLKRALGVASSSVLPHKPVTRQPNSDWKHPPPPREEFKATSRPTEKNGLEKDISDIRISLNKISKKNYETQSQSILKIIDSYLRETDEDSIVRIAHVIFDVSSSNSFLLELTVKIYLELISKSDIFLVILHKWIEMYKETYELSVLRIADPEERNKQNDKRRGASSFIVQLMKNNVVSVNEGLALVTQLFDKIDEYISMVGFTGEVDEISENINIFISMGHDSLKTSGEDWDTIYDRICILGEMKYKDKPSISNRALFRFRDLLDLL